MAAGALELLLDLLGWAYGDATHGYSPPAIFRLLRRCRHLGGALGAER